MGAPAYPAWPHFYPPSPAGPLFLETRSINTAAALYLYLGLAQGDLQVSRSGSGGFDRGEPGKWGCLGKRVLARKLLPQEAACGRWRWVNWAVGLSQFL